MKAPACGCDERCEDCIAALMPSREEVLYQAGRVKVVARIAVLEDALQVEHEYSVAHHPEYEAWLLHVAEDPLDMAAGADARELLRLRRMVAHD
jgi:hypothetical protein